ncbi:MAG: FAD-dependent oxidoreductase, partial [Francisellaceae bacterium]|nr:FAD-dependent oxidoreductase [Francisellaceae bacterium]
IIGGGIAGLWNYILLSQQGYKVVLIENNTLGSGQTIASQGIIHSGIKYSLNANLSNATISIKDMPNLWRQCLNGSGLIDLSQTKVNSTEHWLWPYKSISAKLTSFFAGHAMLSKVNRKPAPSWFKEISTVNEVYSLDEIVLDIPSLLTNMQNLHPDNIIKCNDVILNKTNNGSVENITISIDKTKVCFKALHYVFTAGPSNTMFFGGKSKDHLSQQRPLHMLWLKANNLPKLFGHVIAGLSSKPILTITSHVCQTSNKDIWYIGGNLAETGADKNEKVLIDSLQQLLSEIFPNLILDAPEYGNFRISRTEGRQANGNRPNSFVINNQHNYSLLWPTKLALAPLSALAIQEYLDSKITKSPANTLSKKYPHPVIAAPPWETK